MRILLSPAKKMSNDPDGLPVRGLPQFLPKTELLLSRLREMSPAQLKELWRCNDSIAAQNYNRVQSMDLLHNLTPAILSYEGIQYQYMAPGVLETQPLTYIGEHLRILSGFYGLLRPFDGVTPYRLEMQARLSVGEDQNLYAFWGDSLAKAFSQETDTLLNLASAEYSRAVLPHLPKGIRWVTCVFGEERGGKLIEKGTLCKMARGEMVRFLAEHAITRPEDVREFHGLGYAYSREHSRPDVLVFLRQPPPKEDWTE